jgi:hypothetical protein
VTPLLRGSAKDHGFESSIVRLIIQKAGANFLRNPSTQIRILLKDTGNIRQILLPFASPSFRVHNRPNLSLQDVLHARNRQRQA